MGIFCECVVPKTEVKFILLNYQSNPHKCKRALSSPLKGHNSISITTNNSNRYSQLYEWEKKAYVEQEDRRENGLNRIPLAKGQGLTNRSGIFQEDTEVSNSQSNKYQLSNEKSRNKRLILPASSLTSTQISPKLFINDEEILLSYDIISMLNVNELIYQGAAIQITKEERKHVVINLFKQLIDINDDKENKAFAIDYVDIISVSKMLYRRTGDKPNGKQLMKQIVFIFQINTCDCYYEFGCTNYGVGNSLFKAIQFLQLNA